MEGEERAFFRREGARCEIGEAGGVTQVAPMDSVFGIYRNPADPTPITATAKLLESIRIYREFRTGAMDGLRAGTSASGPKHPLNEDGSNLALLLQDMEFCGSRRPVESRLRELLEQFERLLVNIEGGSVRLFLEERSLGKVSASRLSDGTLKFLCLMAILYDHAPPPLVCIEEPETGLHPEALRIVAAALRDASERMQLIVTTHSEALVSAFTGEPESVLVCEREFNEGTQFSRLSLDRLAEWLETYTLGELWLKGEIGGTRW